MNQPKIVSIKLPPEEEVAVALPLDVVTPFALETARVYFAEMPVSVGFVLLIQIVLPELRPEIESCAVLGATSITHGEEYVALVEPDAVIKSPLWLEKRLSSVRPQPENAKIERDSDARIIFFIRTPSARDCSGGFSRSVESVANERMKCA